MDLVEKFNWIRHNSGLATSHGFIISLNLPLSASMIHVGGSIGNLFKLVISIQ